MLGVRVGVTVTGEAVSGFEFGFTIGVDEAGLMGVIVGTVVIGVVMSLWVVEIRVANFASLSSWPTTFMCPTASFSVAFKPVLQINQSRLYFPLFFAFWTCKAK